MFFSLRRTHVLQVRGLELDSYSTTKNSQDIQTLVKGNGELPNREQENVLTKMRSAITIRSLRLPGLKPQGFQSCLEPGSIPVSRPFLVTILTVTYQNRGTCPGDSHSPHLLEQLTSLQGKLSQELIDDYFQPVALLANQLFYICSLTKVRYVSDWHTDFQNRNILLCSNCRVFFRVWQETKRFNSMLIKKSMKNLKLILRRKTYQWQRF